MRSDSRRKDQLRVKITPGYLDHTEGLVPHRDGEDARPVRGHGRTTD